MTVRSYLSPNGSPILGTIEKVDARADISGIDDETGEPAFDGNTEVFWDSQTTETNADGKTIFVDSDGDSWTFDQLVPAPEDAGTSDV